MAGKSHGEVRLINGKRVASPEYRAWQSIKKRCYNPNCAEYPHYGGRGITVHPAWRGSFEAFLDDVGRRPSDRHTLDRYPDRDGNYEPGNVRWATRLEQSRNRDYCRIVTIDGDSRMVWEWAEFLGLKPKSIHHYLWDGSLERKIRAKKLGHQ